MELKECIKFQSPSGFQSWDFVVRKHGICLGHPAWVLQVRSWLRLPVQPSLFSPNANWFPSPCLPEFQTQNCSVLFGIFSCHSNLGSHLYKLIWLFHGSLGWLFLLAVTLPLNGYLFLFRQTQLQPSNRSLSLYNAALANVCAHFSQFFTNSSGDITSSLQASVFPSTLQNKVPVLHLGLHSEAFLLWIALIDP